LHDYLPVKSIEAEKRSLFFWDFSAIEGHGVGSPPQFQTESNNRQAPPGNFLSSFRLFLDLLMQILGLWQVIQQGGGRGDVSIPGNLIVKVLPIRGKTDCPELCGHLRRPYRSFFWRYAGWSKKQCFQAPERSFRSGTLSSLSA
jgi:hypothetical protein